MPIQLIYQGKTKRCQPTYPFPREFHVTQTENHWANEDTGLDPFKEVLVLHIRDYSLISNDSFSTMCAKYLNFLHLDEN